MLVSGAAFGAPGGTTTSTAFILQNLGDQTANLSVEFRGTDGAMVGAPITGITVDVGSTYDLDQRYQTIPDLGTSFKGSVIASADQPMGAVVNLMRIPSGTGAVNGYESYNGFGQATVGQSVILPQILKLVSSGGLFYSTEIAIQNTDTANAATVNLVFTPDPTLNPLVCQAPSTCISAPYSAPAVTIPAGGTYVLNQATQAAAQIGDVFFGSVQVTSDRDVAVQVLSTGADASDMDQVLLAYPSYSGGTTGEIALASVYKEIMSLGDSYSTAFLIANMGSQEATVEIRYSADLIGTVGSTVDTVQVGANAVKNVDQRYDAPMITSATFLGSAKVQCTNGQPIAVMVNLRGGARYALTYDGVTAGANTLYLPVNYKNLSSAGYEWSSTPIIVNYGTQPANVNISYYAIIGTTNEDAGTIVVTSTQQVDLRYTPSLSDQANFYGAIVLESDQPIGAMVQTRGAGGAGDALLAYKGLGR